MKGGKTVVAIFIRGFHNGGIEKVFESYFTNIDLNPFEIHFITHLKNISQIKKRFENMGFIIHELSHLHGHRLTYRNIKEYRLLFKENDFDVIHNNMPENLLPLFYARKHRIPRRILHAHNNYTANYSFKQKLLSPFYKVGFAINAVMATDLIGVSTDAGKSVFGRRPFILQVNAIELERFSFDQTIRDKYRKLLSVSQDEILLGNVGRIQTNVNSQKNQEFALAVFEKLCDENPKYKLIFIGDGKKRPYYEKLAARSKYSSRIRFLGNVSNVQDYLMAMDCFLFPSRKEGLGIAAVEAQATGLKCIISDRVPHEVKVTDNIVFAKIEGEDAVDVWKQAVIDIIRSGNQDRSNFVQIVRDAGYDIKEQASGLSAIYLK